MKYNEKMVLISSRTYQDVMRRCNEKKDEEMYNDYQREKTKEKEIKFDKLKQEEEESSKKEKKENQHQKEEEKEEVKNSDTNQLEEGVSGDIGNSEEIPDLPISPSEFLRINNKSFADKQTKKSKSEQLWSRMEKQKRKKKRKGEREDEKSIMKGNKKQKIIKKKWITIR
jgi:hypothetical protein